MKLNYLDQGSGEPVVLMHGLFGSLNNLGSLTRSLLDKNRVIGIDLRNHGDSPHQQAMDYPLMAADVIELLDDLGIATANLIGHSMGGKVAMQIALTYPERLNKMVIVDIAPVNYESHHGDILDGLKQLSETEITSRTEADKLLAAYEPEIGVRAFLLKNLKKLPTGGYGLRLNLTSIVANYHTSLVVAPQGEPFPGEVLFVKGENSSYIQTQHREMILNLFPAAKIKTMTGTGHWLHAEKPETFNKLVHHFLESGRSIEVGIDRAGL